MKAPPKSQSHGLQPARSLLSPQYSGYRDEKKLQHQDAPQAYVERGLFHLGPALLSISERVCCCMSLSQLSVWAITLFNTIIQLTSAVCRLSFSKLRFFYFFIIGSCLISTKSRPAILFNIPYYWCYKLTIWRKKENEPVAHEKMRRYKPDIGCSSDQWRIFCRSSPHWSDRKELPSWWCHGGHSCKLMETATKAHTKNKIAMSCYLQTLNANDGILYSKTPQIYFHSCSNRTESSRRQSHTYLRWHPSGSFWLSP